MNNLFTATDIENVASYANAKTAIAAVEKKTASWGVTWNASFHAFKVIVVYNSAGRAVPLTVNLRDPADWVRLADSGFVVGV